MPTYEYACRSCGTHLEVVQRFDDEPLSDCPGCGGQLRKVFGSIGISFKGSGFYKTDSRALAKTGAGPSSTASGDGASPKGTDGASPKGTDGASPGRATDGAAAATKEPKGSPAAPAPAPSTSAPTAKSA